MSALQQTSDSISDDPDVEIRVRQEKGYKVTTIIRHVAPESDPVRYAQWVKLQRDWFADICQEQR